MCGSGEGRRVQGQNGPKGNYKRCPTQDTGEVRLAGTPMWPVTLSLAIPGLVVRHL